MPFESSPGFEAVLEELREKFFIFREGNHAVADIPGRQDIKLLAQAAAGAAVVSHCNDGSQCADENVMCRAGSRKNARLVEMLESL